MYLVNMMTYFLFYWGGLDTMSAWNPILDTLFWKFWLRPCLNSYLLLIIIQQLCQRAAPMAGWSNTIRCLLRMTTGQCFNLHVLTIGQSYISIVMASPANYLAQTNHPSTLVVKCLDP